MISMRYRFDRFTVDIEGGTFAGPLGHIALPEKPFRLLCALVIADGRVLDKETLMAAVWPNQIVSDASLATALKALRYSVGDTGTTQRLFETVKGRGIRMAVPVFPLTTGAVKTETFETETPLVGERPTIAVLRFASTKDQLGRAIPADLISALSVSRDIGVIARGSSFQHLSGESRPANLRELCGADYVLSGEIVGPPSQRRISIELADARTEVIVWNAGLDLAGASDRELSAEGLRKIVPELSKRIVGHESRRAAKTPTEMLSAWQSYHLGVSERHKNTPDSDRRAMVHLQRAVALDPDFSSAYAMLSDAAFSTAFNYYASDRDAHLERSLVWADRAIEIDPENALACAAKGRSYWLRKAPADGIPWLDQALEIDPNSAYARYSRGVLCNLLGHTERTEADVALAIQNSPIDPNIYSMRGHLGLACLQREDFSKGLEWAEHAVRSPRTQHMVLFVASVAASLAGEKTRAQHWKSELARVAPQITSERFFDSMPLRPKAQKAFTKAFDRIS